MKLLPAFLLALVAAGLALVLSAAFSPKPDAAAGAEAAALREEVQALQAAQEALLAQIDALRVQPASAPPELQRLPDLERMVQDAVARALAAGASPPAAGDTAPPASAFSTDAALLQLLDPGVDDTRRDALWRQANETGQFEALLAMLEARAKAAPNDAQLQYELGYGYLQPLINGTVAGVEAGQWSMKADRAFDATLALDPEHWDARFNKAVSYTFWPPIFGKQKDAIAQFEILIEQQSRRAPAPEYADTYFYLGNMYQQTGQADKAREIWNLGLAAYPDSPQLRERLGLQ